jgi:endogenous inhibitor of DNA gyrase (YacG/DUF329 family)
LSAPPPGAPPRPVRRCPICGKPRVERYRPFCSRACRDRDFIAWAEGRYAIPAVEGEEDDAEPSPDAGASR